jgi:hypothetical protein
MYKSKQYKEFYLWISIKNGPLTLKKLFKVKSNVPKRFLGYYFDFLVNNTFHIILSNVKEAIKLIGMQK